MTSLIHLLRFLAIRVQVLIRHMMRGRVRSGYPLHRENRENGQKKSVIENTGNLEILPKHRENTGNLVCSSCKFPYSNGKRYFYICRENFNFFLKLEKSAKSVLCM